MMNKRGQVTVFVIIGIVIVVAVFLVFYFLGDRFKRDTDVDIVFDESNVEPMIKLVEDCVSDEVVKGVEFVGLQGGYFDPPKYFELEDYKLSYNCHKDESGVYVNRLPTLSRISQEIEEYLSSDRLNKIEECIDGFKFYKNQGYKINYENIDNMGLKVTIGSTIIVNVVYPVQVERGDFSSSFNSISFQIDSGLITAHSVATDIINDECSGIIFDIDDYIINNPPLAYITRQIAPEDLGYFYYLETIPTGNENMYKFHFIIER